MTPVSQTIYSLCLLAGLFALMTWKVRRNRRLGQQDGTGNPAGANGLDPKE